MQCIYDFMQFINYTVYHKAKRLAIKEGMPVDQFKKHECDPNIQKNAKYVSVDLVSDIYEWAAENLKAGFSIRQGLQLEAEDYGTLGLSWKTCWKAREVLDRIARYMLLVTNHGTVTVKDHENFTTIFLNREAKRIAIEIANEASFVMLVNVIYEVTGKPIKPLEVNFMHNQTNADPYHEYFGCPVNFGRANNSMTFKKSDLDINTIKADKSIHEFLIERMNEEENKININTDQLLLDINRIIKEILPSGIPSISKVAEFLGMSVRTLNRRLSEKGETYRALVQENQKQSAKDLLLNSSQNIAEIAFNVGFSEQSAFNRAFKRWEGTSPIQYRKEN